LRLLTSQTHPHSPSPSPPLLSRYVFYKLKDDLVSGSFTASLLPNDNWCDDVESVAESQLVSEVEVRVLTVVQTS
jgi:hypothetical protein